jgi:hypothetical protein
MFESISTMQEATLREWPLLSPSLIAQLQQFLLAFVINRMCSSSNVEQLDKYLLKHILQTLAVFYKRSKFDVLPHQIMTMKRMINEPSSSSSSSSTIDASSNIVKDIIQLFKSSNIKLVHSFLHFILNY